MNPVEPVELDPDDPFEATLISMLHINRRKRADYALDGDPFSNFRESARFLGVEPWMVALGEACKKLSRISALRANGRADDPQNEPLGDSVLDFAVYAAIALALYKEEKVAGPRGVSDVSPAQPGRQLLRTGPPE